MAGLRQIDYGAPTDKCAITVRLGVDKGFFEDEGLDLSVKVVFGGPEIAAAYDSGELQIGEMGSPPAITAIAAGKRFTIIGSGCRQRAHMYLAVHKDIESYDGLRGKRIGHLGTGSCPDWIARKILRTEGLDPDRDVTFVPLLAELPRVIEYMEEGRLEAGLIAEPLVSIGEEKGILKVWAAGFDAPYLPHYQWIVRVAKPELIERDPDLVAAVLRGCQRSAHYAVVHTDEWAAFATRYFGADEAAIRRAIAREAPHYQLDCRIDAEGLQKSIDMQMELGGIDRPLTVDDVADLRFQPDLKAAA